MSVTYTGTLLTGLTGDWKFEGNGQDSGPNAGHLSLFGSPTYINPGALLGQAIKLLSAVDNYGTLADNALWELPTRTGKMTIACWVNTDTTGTRPLIIKGTATNAVEYGLFLFTGTSVNFRVGNGTTATTLAHSTTIALDVWAFIVATFDTAGGSAALRLAHGLYNAAGGQSMVAWQTAASVGVNATTSPLELFRIPYSTGTRYDGSCARMSLWERVLTQAEVDQLYNSGKGYDVPATGVRKLKVGAATVTDLRIGSTNVQTVKLGGTTVWSR
jgi:hypothetical protein